MYKLLLDDVRNPPKDKDGTVESGWRIARTVDQAINIVLSNGIPDHVAFDHDLGTQENGMDFAKWLCLQCDYLGIKPTFTFDVHSQNPCGAENIRSYVQQYIDIRNQEDEC